MESSKKQVPEDEYEIHIAEKLTELWVEPFYNWTLTGTEEGMTCLRGMVRDQAELYGIISSLRNMGLTLLRVVKLHQQNEEGVQEHQGGQGE